MKFSFTSIFSKIPAILGASVVAIEAAAEKGLVNANSPTLNKVLGWTAIGSIFLSALQTALAPAAPVTPAPAPVAAPSAPAA